MGCMRTADKQHDGVEIFRKKSEIRKNLFPALNLLKFLSLAPCRQGKGYRAQKIGSYRVRNIHSSDVDNCTSFILKLKYNHILPEME